MEDYEYIVIHLLKNKNLEGKAWCRALPITRNYKFTEKESEATCKYCLKNLKRERDRIKKLNKMRKKLGWNPINSI